tara:strand:- start:840 stop:1475 length:636 start_codon:yes stop_codon:yes gene_type:complete
MFGTMLCVLLTQQNIKFKGDGRGPNAHASGYKRTLGFHSVFDYDDIVNAIPKIQEKMLGEILGNRTGLKNNVYNLSSYQFLNFPFSKFFNDYTSIVLRPKNKYTLKYYAKRFASFFGEEENFAKAFGNPSVQIRNKLKHLQRMDVIADSLPSKDVKDIMYFDPIDFFDIDKTQKFLDDVCSRTKIDKIEIPKREYLQFMKKNKPFFDKMSK